MVQKEKQEEMLICSNSDCEFVGKPQPHTNFYKRKDRPKGITSDCKSCYKRRAKSYYIKNREKVALYQKQSKNR